MLVKGALCQFSSGNTVSSSNERQMQVAERGNPLTEGILVYSLNADEDAAGCVQDPTPRSETPVLVCIRLLVRKEQPYVL